MGAVLRFDRSFPKCLRQISLSERPTPLARVDRMYVRAIQGMRALRPRPNPRATGPMEGRKYARRQRQSCKRPKLNSVEQAAIVEKIQFIRREGRDYNLRCQASHEMQDTKEGERRRQRIATLQADLMQVQAQLGDVNRSIRAQKPSQVVERRTRARKELKFVRTIFCKCFVEMIRRLHPDSFYERNSKGS